jgi:hypothetical protein
MPAMEIISSEEFELTVAPLFNRGLTTVVDIGDQKSRLISQRFDYIKVISNPYSVWFDIEPIELQRAIINAASRMGDDFVCLSFVGYSDIVEPNVPLNFKFPIEELFQKKINLLKMQVEAYLKEFFGNVLYYSPQGLWAATTEMECYGTLGMTKDFLALVRNIYPQLDEELDRQLFDFIRWCNGLDDEWTYTKVGDDEVCEGWCRGWLEYMCRIDISNHYTKLNSDPDVIDIYRDLKV